MSILLGTSNLGIGDTLHLHTPDPSIFFHTFSTMKIGDTISMVRADQMIWIIAALKSGNNITPMASKHPKHSWRWP